MKNAQHLCFSIVSREAEQDGYLDYVRSGALIFCVGLVRQKERSTKEENKTDRAFFLRAQQDEVHLQYFLLFSGNTIFVSRIKGLCTITQYRVFTLKTQ